MSRIHMTGLLALFLAGLAVAAQDAPMPEPPQPTKEHEWLGRLAGEWTVEGECSFLPDQPPVKVKGTQSATKVGPYFVLIEFKAEMMEKPFQGFLSLGYDLHNKQIVGSSFGSMDTYLWNYTGNLDVARNLLTLNAEGPCPQTHEMIKIRETIELKGHDHIVYTSVALRDGQWKPAMKLDIRRKG